MSVKDKIKQFQVSQNSSAANTPSKSPGKLDMSKFANFQTPKKMEVSGKNETYELPEYSPLESLIEEVNDNFVTPYSDRMSLTPAEFRDEAPLEEACMELHHRLLFLSHPSPPN